MFAYSPDKFASLYASELGQRIWAFLTQDDNVARLETASQLSKPAVEGIEEELLAELRGGSGRSGQADGRPHGAADPGATRLGARPDRREGPVRALQQGGTLPPARLVHLSRLPQQ